MIGHPPHPLPHPELVIGYLDIYPEYRKDDRKALLNTFKYSLEKFSSFVTTLPPVDDELDDMVKKRRRDMGYADSPDAWYSLIFKLRKNAERAQALVRSGRQSVLRNTFHGCANLIIDELERCLLDPETEDYELYKNVLAQKIAVQTRKANTLEAQIKDNAKLGKDNTKSNADYNKVVLELAWLGVEEFVNIAMVHQLLPTLTIPLESELTELKLTPRPADLSLSQQSVNLDSPSNFANMSVPIVLQRHHPAWFYGFKFQTKCLHISFNEFRTTHIKKSEERRVEIIIISTKQKTSDESATDTEKHKGTVENNTAEPDKSKQKTNDESATDTEKHKGTGENNTAEPDKSKITKASTEPHKIENDYNTFATNRKNIEKAIESNTSSLKGYKDTFFNLTSINQTPTPKNQTVVNANPKRGNITKKF